MAQSFTASEQDGVLVVEFPPESNLDGMATEEIEKPLTEAVEGSPKVLIDFSNVPFMSSVALGFLLTLHLKAVRTGRRLALVELNDNLMNVLRLMHLNDVYEIHPTREAALAALRG